MRTTRMSHTYLLKKRLATALLILVKTAIAFMMFFPIIWIISGSFKTQIELTTFPPTLFPKEWDVESYQRILTDGAFYRYFFNTVILMVGTAVGTLLSSSLVAYPLARMNFTGKNFFFAIIVATMLVPGISLIIPQYQMFGQLGWLDTLLPMIVPAWFAHPYNVFLFRQFFRSIPKELDESASIDGCSKVMIYFRMLVPLSVPTFVTIAVMSSVSWWNELTQPVIYLTSDKWRPLTVAVMARYTHFGDDPFAMTWNTLMAASALLIIPPMIMYLCGSKYLVDGIKTTGMKG